MALREDNNMLEELASATADPAFGHGIGIGRQLLVIVTLR
jgi:hypothetical protein